MKIQRGGYPAHLQFEYVQQGMKLTLFSKREDGDMVNLGLLLFTDETGNRPDLLEAFLAQTKFEKEN